MGTTTRRYEGRYTIGKRQPDGRRPVFVDGAQEPTGYVWSTGHGAQPWAADGSETHPAEYPTMSERRWQAAERIVALVDVHKEATAQAHERRERAGRVPQGWRVASWDEIVREGFRRVRLVAHHAYLNPEHDGTPDAGERYALAYREQPVRLLSVSRHCRTPALQALYGDFVMASYEGLPLPHTADGNHAIALGALVEVDTPRRTVSAVACPECGAHEALYATGARTACGACTARALGWDPADLPFPISDDDPVFSPGDVVALDVPGTDGITDTYTGTVHEWEAFLGSESPYRGGGVRNVRVAFPFLSGGMNCAPAMLRPAERLEDASAETVDGWRAGMEAVRFDYNAGGVAFETRGVVAGFCDGPDGARWVRFTTSPVVPATPYPPGEVFHIGSDAAWRASQPRKRTA